MKDDEVIMAPATRTRTLTSVALYALLISVYSVLPAWKEYTRYATVADLPSEIHAALTLVLGLLLVFRTNTAYARWWEARTLWGALVNACRNLAAKTTVLVNVDDADLTRARQLITGFPQVLRDHLRDKPSLEQIEGFKGIGDAAAHLPGWLVEQYYRLLNTWKSSGQIDGDELRILDEELRRFLDICGGCERIRRTRIAKSYRVFARQCVWLFLVTFPWGIADEFGWWTIPLTTITAYFMVGLETVAEHVEEPFGYDEDDLDLDTLCNTIAVSVNDIFRRRLEEARS